MTENLHENAFPSSGHSRYEGMELRDYFAAKFAAAIYSSYDPEFQKEGKVSEIVNEAYELADAMMVARKGHAK